MSDPPPEVNLTSFDAAIPIEPDPRVWTANLAALRAEQGRFAARLEPVNLPAHWRSVRGLDGFTTFRIEPPGTTPAWLAGSAAPATRAAGLLETLDTGAQNPTLPALGAGAELRLLLERLPDDRAVYVFEPELAVIAAVLRTLELAEPIACGRCVLVPPAEELAFLAEHLAAHPGLLPPGLIICPPYVPADRIEPVRAICQQVAQKAHVSRRERLGQLADAVSPVVADHDPPHLALVALAPAHATLPTADALAGAARGLGWPVVECLRRGPHDVHTLAHAERLASFQPDITVCINHSATHLPLRLPGTVCEWFHDSTEVPEKLPQDEALRLAATPRVHAALQAAAPRGARPAPWYWACDADVPAGTEACPDTVLLIGDLPDDDPAAWGIEQPSHRQLWAALRRRASEHWTAQHSVSPESLLREVERSAGLHLGVSSVRELLLRAVERGLLPRVVLENVVQTLGPGLRLLTVGTGWQRWPAKEIQPFAPSVFAIGADVQRCCPLAAILVAVPDPLTPAVLAAGARGWPLLIYDPGDQPLSAALGGVLHPHQDYLSFCGPRELQAALQAGRADPAGTMHRAARLRERLCRQHSWQHRLHELKALVQAR